MGWCQSLPLFSIASETAQDAAQGLLDDTKQELPPHPLEHYCLPPPGTLPEMQPEHLLELKNIGSLCQQLRGHDPSPNPSGSGTVHPSHTVWHPQGVSTSLSHPTRQAKRNFGITGYSKESLAASLYQLTKEMRS